ncbi:MAG TPA: hypothetical protein VII75_03785 [Thermoanaerobaculia bacterium]
MAAYDESELDDLRQNLRRSRDQGKGHEDFPSGRASSKAAETFDSTDSQISDRELESLLGLAPSSASAGDHGLYGCPRLVRLNDILENADAASAGELRHIQVCPDCVSRVRAFRTVRREEALKLFESKLDLLRETCAAFTPVVQEAEGHARLLFLMIGQDTDPQRWQIEAWSCTRKVAAALRIARNQKATLVEMETILELFMTAIGTAASNPISTCSRVTDGAWPIVEMVKHTAIHIALNDPSLFRSFCRYLGATVRLSTRRMKAMLTYSMVDLLQQRIVPDIFAPGLVHEISACDLADAVRLVLASQLPERSALRADLRFAVADAMGDPRVEAVSNSIARGRFAIEAALLTPRMSSEEVFENVLGIVGRFCNDLFAAAEPEEAMLRLIALRQIVRDVTREAVRPDLAALFRSITELVLEQASQRSGSTFFAMEVWNIFRDVVPAFLELINDLPMARFPVRQAVLNSLADGYAALFGGDMQSVVPRFHRRNLRWNFAAGDVASPLDPLCVRIAEIAGEADMDKHLLWFNRKLDTWSEYLESTISAI